MRKVFGEVCTKQLYSMFLTRHKNAIVRFDIKTGNAV